MVSHSLVLRELLDLTQRASIAYTADTRRTMAGAAAKALALGLAIGTIPLNDVSERSVVFSSTREGRGSGGKPDCGALVL